MSPEAAASVVASVPCSRCKAETGDRCRRRNERLTPSPHRQRVLADLFKPHERKP